VFRLCTLLLGPTSDPDRAHPSSEPGQCRPVDDRLTDTRPEGLRCRVVRGAREHTHPRTPGTTAAHH